MSIWGVQLVIGRLLTDETFRRRFEQGSRECLIGERDRGIALDDPEIAALSGEDPRVWSTMAARIDQRLRQTNVRQEASAPGGLRPLTGREQLVLRAVFDGQTNKQIGATLGISEAAVKATIQNLFRKTHARTRAQLVRITVEGSFAGTPRKP